MLTSTDLKAIKVGGGAARQAGALVPAPPPRRGGVRRGLLAGMTGAMLLATGVGIVPPAWHAYRLYAAADDPAALADLRLIKLRSSHA